MAFHFFGEDGEVEVSYLTNQSEAVVTVQIGFDEVTDNTYSLMVCLTPPAGGFEGEFEFAFCIIEYDHDEECEYRLWDGLQTRYKIPDPQHRDGCLAILRAAIEILIEEVSPTVVTMITHSPDLPAKALRKYHFVANVFSKGGFTISQPDPYHGRLMWIMERVS